MMSRNSKSYNEQMQALAKRYRAAGQRWPATAREISVWLIRNSFWEPQEGAVISQCADHLARAMREEYYTDAQGRRVRVNHAARFLWENKQLTFWDDIRGASRTHMHVSLQQRRNQIVGDCKQLKTDMESYNDNTNTGKPIQMVFDFTRDLKEGEAAA